MKTSKSGRNALILLLIVVFPSLLFFGLFYQNGDVLLPFHGPREAVTVVEGGKQRIDTVYHEIPDFSFTNQDGRIVTRTDMDSMIYVADFFFATCPGICPVMTDNLIRVQEAFADDPYFHILSHTVDPEKDTVEALKAYAELRGADPAKWDFLTGDKAVMYELAMHGYFASIEEQEEGAVPQFLHSPYFFLIDKEKHIRGFYEGTDSAAVDSMIKEIKILRAGYVSLD